MMDIVQEYYFQLGSFPELSQEEIAHAFPGFSGRYDPASNILWGSFNSPLTNLKKRKKPDFQQHFDTLGGSVRAGMILGEAEQPIDFLPVLLARLEHFARATEKKIVFGVAFIGSKVQERVFQKILQTLLIGVKKTGKERGLSLRFINRNFRNLDAGTYWKEGLSESDRAEFCFFRSGQKFVLTETLAAQRVEAFAARDYGKPVRDMQVGMLPPKLALMMLNLARNERGELPSMIWDPFCGTGTILIEAERLDVRSFGSDLNPEMVAASRRNMHHFFPGYPPSRIIQHDAMAVLERRMQADTIVTEGYLGPIRKHPINDHEFFALEAKLQKVYSGFFRALRAAPEVRKIIIALPFWRGAHGRFYSLENILMSAHKLGYSTEAFETGTKRGSLEFLRENQVVGREIFCFVRR